MLCDELDFLNSIQWLFYIFRYISSFVLLMNFTFLVQLVLDNAFCFLCIGIQLRNYLMFLIINDNFITLKFFLLYEWIFIWPGYCSLLTCKYEKGKKRSWKKIWLVSWMWWFWSGVIEPSLRNNFLELYRFSHNLGCDNKKETLSKFR